MTIIEREIAKREALIAEKLEKQARIAELKSEMETLSNEVEQIDTVVLEAEIGELKSYLPKPEQPDVDEDFASEEVEAVAECSEAAALTNSTVTL